MTYDDFMRDLRAATTRESAAMVPADSKVVVELDDERGETACYLEIPDGSRLILRGKPRQP